VTFTFSTVIAPHSISATFAIKTYAISASAGANGAMSPSPTATVNHGGNQTFTITPVTGFNVLGVFVDGGPTAVTTSAPDLATGAVTFTFSTVIAPHSISATFAIKTYAISASAGANGAMSPSPTATVNHGGNQTFTITPVTGFNVLGVFVDGGSTAVTTSAPDPTTGAVTFTFTNVTGPHSISATFVIKTYAISASAGANGVISPAPTATVTHGTDQTFTFTPSVNFHVADVLVDGTSVGAVTFHTFTGVTTTHTIAVTFAIDTNDITASAGANGSITPSGIVPVNHGADQTFIFTPDENHVVDDVSVDGVSKGAVTSRTFINVTTPHTILVTFRVAAPNLVLLIPGDKTTVIPGTFSFEFSVPTQGVKHELCLKTDDAAFATTDCEVISQKTATALLKTDVIYAGVGTTGMGILWVVGSIFGTVLRRSKKMTLALFIVAGLLLSSCSDGGSNTPTPTSKKLTESRTLEANKTYFWKVISTDSQGTTTESETRSFKTS